MNKKILQINSYIFLPSNFKPKINGKKVSYSGRIININDYSIISIKTKEIDIEEHMYLKIQYDEYYSVESIDVIGNSKVSSERSSSSNVDLVVFIPLSIFSKSKDKWFLKKQMIFDKIFNSLSSTFFKKYYCEMEGSVANGYFYIKNFSYKEISSKTYSNSLKIKKKYDLGFDIVVEVGSEVSSPRFSDSEIKMVAVIKDGNKYIFSSRNKPFKVDGAGNPPIYKQKKEVSVRWWQDMMNKQMQDEDESTIKLMVMSAESPLEVNFSNFELIDFYDF